MRLLPHDASFFQFFEQQGKKTVEGCRAFLEMVEHPKDLDSQAERVKQIEHECDEITHAVVQSLHKTFITPIDRNDIYTLITKMDDIMDLVEAAAERLSLYELPTMTKEVGDLARSFGTMSGKLQKQFAALETFSDVDRLLLDEPELPHAARPNASTAQPASALILFLITTSPLA